MGSIKDKLKEVVSKTPSKWLDDANWRQENQHWIEKSQRIALRILRELKDKKISQAALAESLGVEPQQISRILKGNENLTLKTISQIELALNVNLISIEVGAALSSGNISTVNVGSESRIPSEKPKVNAQQGWNEHNYGDYLTAA
jgi:transcriptional regulator with XRE-family HTH domain